MPEHIFISYSHKDSYVADMVANALYRADIPIFIDRIALHPGESLRAKLGQGLQDARALIVLISENSISSEWVLNELTAVKELNIQVIPFQCDKTTWPARLRLLLGDSLYLDGAADLYYALGVVPKIFPVESDAESTALIEGIKYRQFFSLRATNVFSPHALFFDGTLQTAWEQKRFGRVGVVLPTDQSIYLGGKVTTSFLNYLGVSANALGKSQERIISRQAALLHQTGMDDLVLIASTVFNQSGEPRAEDQWRAAEAILKLSEQNQCSLVLVPPLGTGSFNWPVRQATVNWLSGAIRWCKNNITITNRSVWPVLCVPGPGDQKILSYYMAELTKERLLALYDGKVALRIRYRGEVSEEIQVNYDLLLGGVARTAFKELKQGDYRFRHGAGLVRRHSRQPFEYQSDTPLAETIFADGDIIEVY